VRTYLPDEELLTATARVVLDRIVTVEPEQAGGRRILSQVCRAHVGNAKHRRRRVHPLEFALTGTEHDFVVAVLAGAAGQILGYLATEALKVGATLSVTGVRRLFGAQTPAASDEPLPAVPTELTELTAAQWEHVQQIVVRVLTQDGNVAPARAELLGAAVVGLGVISGSSR
jgi:hypothetical protein